MSKFHVGIKADTHRVDVVVLKDGVYEMAATRDITEEYVKKPGIRFDRGFHLNEISCFVEELVFALGDEDNVSIVVEAADYSNWYVSQRALVEQAQMIGAIMALPYVVHEVANTTWKNVIVGKGGVTREDVETAVDERFNLRDRFKDNARWYDAFCLARFGYVKDEPNT